MHWWLDFLPSWFGTSFILESIWAPSTKMQLFTDISGTHGWGTYWSEKWVHGQWSEAQLQLDITWKEVSAIVIAIHTWGVFWQRQKISIHCNILITVTKWESGSIRAKETMALVCLLYYCAARYNINICIVHIACVNNMIADCLFHFQQSKFRQLAPLSNLTPSTIPAWLIHSFIDSSCSATVLVQLLQPVKLNSQVLMSSIHFSQYHIILFPASSLTLKSFCSYAS